MSDCASREENRQAEIKELTSKGIIPAVQDVEQHPEKSKDGRPWLMGRVSAVRFLLLSRCSNRLIHS